MSKLERQFHEDKALRDAARTVLMADVEHARASFSVEGLTGRVGERIGDGAKDVFEVAKTQADDNRGILAALIGAILLWLGREPILNLLGLNETDEEAGESISDPSVQHTENDDPHTQTDDNGGPLADETVSGDDNEQ